MAPTRVSPPRAAVDLTFEELYRGHHEDVYRAALRELGNAHDAEDVTQAAFVDAYRAVLGGTEPRSPRAWLLAISENVRRRRFRTAQRRPREETLDDADFPLAADLSHEQAQALAEALAALPSEQRRVFVLREIVGLSYEEIADEVDSTVGSVQMLLFRARRSLRQELEPPTVAIQRTGGFLPPFPGWLAGLVSRVELTVLTPRAAGVVGAAALTVAGASVAVPTSQAEQRERPAGAAKSDVSHSAKPAGARLVASSAAARSPKRTAASPVVVRAAPRVQPAPRSRPGAIPAPTSAPPATDPSAGAPSAGSPQPASAPELAAAPVTMGSQVVPTPVELPAPPAAPVPVRPTLPVQVPPVVPVQGPPAVSVPAPPVASVHVPPVSAPVPAVGAGPVPLPAAPSLPAPVDPTGAAGAAGASAPPVPVPSLPLPTLPPTP